MLKIDRYSSVPIYEQVINGFERLVLVGALSPGSQLPSVRSLSQELSINPNTLQKAYAELDRRGISTAVPGKGRFISEDALNNLKSCAGDMLSELSSAVERLALCGIGLNKIISYIEAAYHTAPEKKGDTK